MATDGDVRRTPGVGHRVEHFWRWIARIDLDEVVARRLLIRHQPDGRLDGGGRLAGERRPGRCGPQAMIRGCTLTVTRPRAPSHIRTKRRCEHSPLRVSE